MDADVQHLLDKARQFHDLVHRDHVPDFEDCQAWTCKRSRLAAERLDNRIFTPPNTRLTKDIDLGEPKWRPMKVMS